MQECSCNVLTLGYLLSFCHAIVKTMFGWSHVVGVATILDFLDVILNVLFFGSE